MIYLASPYSHEDINVRTARFWQACDAAAVLIQQGYSVFSPIAHSHPIAGHGGLDAMDGELWARQDAPFVEACDSLVVLKLDGWDTSAGIAAEIAAFATRGIAPTYMDPIDPAQ